MRLARGSGVDGLSGMARGHARPRASSGSGRSSACGARRCAAGWRREGVAWAEDPSNADARFDRVRARAALPGLAALGIGAGAAGGDGAGDGARARGAGAGHGRAGRRAASTEGGAGDLLLDPAPLRRRRRRRCGCGCSPAALCWVSGAVYRPRLLRLEAALAAVERRPGRARPDAARLRAAGPRAAASRSGASSRAWRRGAAGGGRWDGRWQIEGDAAGGRRPDDRRAGCRGPGAARTAHRPGRRARRWWRRRRSGARVSSSRRRWRAPEAGFGFRRVSAVPPPWDVAEIVR